MGNGASPSKTNSWPIGEDLIGRSGKYRVYDKAAIGGFGLVFHARNLGTNRPVAVKLLKEELAANPAAMARFGREVRIGLTRRFDPNGSPVGASNLVEILDQGTTEGIPFLVMEWLDGWTVAEVMDHYGGKLPSADAVAIACQALQGLSALHSVSIVHRDIKPSNLMLMRDGRVKVIDLGIARATDPHATIVTDSDVVPLTPAYAAPEQLEGKPDLTGTADLYSLGATLYYMISGKAPFSGFARPDPSQLQPLPRDVPPHVAVTIFKALAPNPLLRWPSAEAMLEELRPHARPQFLPDLPDYVDRPALEPARVPQAEAGQQQPNGSRSQPGFWSVVPWVISVVCLLALTGLVGFMFGGGSLRPPSAPSPVAAAQPPVQSVPTPSPSAVLATPTRIPSTSTPARAAATPTPPPSQTSTPLLQPPSVANSGAASAYRGTTLTYYGDSVGPGNDIDNALAKQFLHDTGIQVNVIPRPQSSTDTLAQYQLILQGHSASLDVLMMDVVWPGLLAPNLVDLSSSMAADAKLHYQTLIDNDTVGGRLVAIPWFGDFGMLYYRTDLLAKYGFAAPPKTWDELEQQARTVLAGERATNPDFTGFVFEGNAYEGLTCVALEWLAASGGGNIVDASGQVTVNNPKAAAMLNRARGWVGTISPRGVTSFQEDDARSVFQGGNALFMRNWPYAYSAAERDDSPIKDKFAVAPLPVNSNEQPVGTVGGWQLAVSKYSQNQNAAIEFVRYLTSPDVQLYRALVGGFVPTMPEVTSRPEVIKAEPFLTNLLDVQRVARPSRQTADRYDRASSLVFQTVNQVLNGTPAEQLLPSLQQQLEQVVHS
jgi:trehalose/maltose transport system substrate-binding protein